MPRYHFSVGRNGIVREAGAVLSDTFEDALTAIAEQSSATQGEQLDIGVEGFPPAHYEYIMTSLASGTWRPQSRLAA